VREVKHSRFLAERCKIIDRFTCYATSAVNDIISQSILCGRLSCGEMVGKANRHQMVTIWLNGNGGGHINEVALRWARLVLGWMTVSGFNSRSLKFISV